MEEAKAKSEKHKMNTSHQTPNNPHTPEQEPNVQSPFLPPQNIQSTAPTHTPPNQQFVQLLSMNPVERKLCLEQLEFNVHMLALHGSNQADEKLGQVIGSIQENRQIRETSRDAALDNVANMRRLLMSLQTGDDGDQEPAADGTESVAGGVGGGVGGFPARVNQPHVQLMMTTAANNRQQMPERNAAPMQQAQVDELKNMVASQKAEMDKLKEMLFSQQSDVGGSYQQRIVSLERQNSAQQIQIDELKRQNGALQTQIDELKRRQAAQQE